jgi:hypothetical protein
VPQFYVQLRPSDLKSLPVPVAMEKKLTKKLKIKEQVIKTPIETMREQGAYAVALWHAHLLEEVEGLRHQSEDGEHGDMLVFKYKNNGFWMQMYRAGTSVKVVWDCAKHSAIVAVVKMII